MPEQEKCFVVECDGGRYKFARYGWVDAVTNIGVPAAFVNRIERAIIAQGRFEELLRASRERADAFRGIKDGGILPEAPPTSSTRRTHCYSCKRALDSQRDARCIHCGWLVCSCGACGCQYQGSQGP
ncbi:MAG: hypothetical protein ABIG71_03895 [Candidatus Uhrbacteria bacterium]